MSKSFKLALLAVLLAAASMAAAPTTAEAGEGANLGCNQSASIGFFGRERRGVLARWADRRDRRIERRAARQSSGRIFLFGSGC